MNNKGRIENSIRNSATGIIVQACSTIMGLFARTFFIRYLSAEYLGVNGLFSNILTMLSLAELGVGGAITYSMYKPVAKKDEKKVAELLNLYRAAYRIIGIVIALIGIAIIPFLGYIIKEETSIENLTLIYALFLGNTVLSYFFAYKRSILSADQMERVISWFALVFQMIRYTLQIVSLILFQNFIVYLIIQIACTFGENVAISIYVDRKYTFLKTYRNERLEDEEKKTIFENIKALFIYKIGSTALDGSDNIIISAFDGIISVGLLSNYALITGSLQTFLYKVTNALTGSVGNFIAKEDSNRHEKLLEEVTFIHFVLYGLLFVGCASAIQPFIRIWAGDSYILPNRIVFVHCLNIYIFGMMNAIWMFRSTMGLFVHGKWRPLVSAVINIVVSIILAKWLGLLGVLIGTTVTRFTTNVWYDPLIVYKHGLHKSPIKYYLTWLSYLLVCIVDIGVIHILEGWLKLSGLIAFLVYGCLSFIIFGCSIFIFYHKSEQYTYLSYVCKNSLVKIKKRFGDLSQ